MPVLVVQMPSEPSVIRFYVALLAAMGGTIAPAPTAAGNGATGAGTAAQGRRAHAGDRRAAQRLGRQQRQPAGISRSEEHTSELQSLMRISYAVFCLKKK